jgi:hypothetical protein
VADETRTRDDQNHKLSGLTKNFAPEFRIARAVSIQDVGDELNRPGF